MKKFLSFILMISLAFTSLSAVGTKPTLAESNYKDREIITDRQYIENFAKERDLDPSEITQIEFVYFEEDNLKSKIENIIPAAYDYYYVKVTRTGGSCGAKSIWTTSGWGPGPISQSQTYSISANFSASIGITKDIVSAGVGFDVGREYSITDSKELPLEAGQYGEIISYPMYRVHSFDIYEKGLFKDKLVGDGHANEPNGICFVTRVR